MECEGLWAFFAQGFLFAQGHFTPGLCIDVSTLLLLQLGVHVGCLDCNSGSGRWRQRVSEEDASLIDKKEGASRDGSPAEACKVSRKARGRLMGISEGQESFF